MFTVHFTYLYEREHLLFTLMFTREQKHERHV
ncbi:hypothetical protein SAMN06265219_11523 [Gracilimonas mengyeensis]|uniref:Uncharacterized protein n=1 Tax=Gracilimonas mengyeensis TaxID=1302730 RepID=A0A521F426_9BACT|nr:hypothetical protein SAMN06265219_11523 [Gracilimonas mengyeensis]